MDVFDNYLHEVCDQFDNMVISGDFNLRDILWDSIDSASGVKELAFIETLRYHLLTQLNKKPIRGNNILDKEKTLHTLQNTPRIVECIFCQMKYYIFVFCHFCSIE